jgi:hypothetical protein
MQIFGSVRKSASEGNLLMTEEETTEHCRQLNRELGVWIESRSFAAKFLLTVKESYSI